MGDWQLVGTEFGPIIDPSEFEDVEEIEDEGWREIYADARDSISFFDDDICHMESARDDLKENADILMDAWRELGGVDEFYRFPAMKNLDEFNNLQQSVYIISEATEAVDACLSQNRNDYGIELMDIIHAAETALRMEFKPGEVAMLRDAVEEKNRYRGYYGGND